jgi:predicted dehydrogenase
MMHKNTLARSVDRRDFLATAAACTATLATSKLTKAASANDRLRLAFIGVGGRGGGNLEEMVKDPGVQVAAICDVHQGTLDRVAERFPDARKYTDFRRLADALKDIDAIVVSSTEHTHAFATLPALQQRKPVYCEKPLTYNIQEAKRIMDEAAAAGVPTQMGTQIHATANYRRVVELIQSGAIGPVTEAHVWTSRAWGLQSQDDAKKNGDIVYVTDRPTQEMQPPKEIDWDLWIGPAPMRPFHEVYLPGPKWYRWWDFANGTMSDLGSHFNDLPFWALQLDHPRTVEAFGPPPHKELAPASMTAVYEYGPRGEWPACRVSWYQGADKPQIWKEKGIPTWDNGILFIGRDGMLLSDYGRHVLLPEFKFANYEGPKPFLRESPGHQQEWIDAVRNGTPTGSPFDYAGLLTIANHLGNVAYRAGQKLEWDAASLRAKNCPAATPFIERTPRAGWSLT